jgi:hypothetical protein
LHFFVTFFIRAVYVRVGEIDRFGQTFLAHDMHANVQKNNRIKFVIIEELIAAPFAFKALKLVFLSDS